MILFLAMSGVIWAIGALMKTPLQARWIMIGLLWVVFVAEHLLLPDGHPVREMTGRDAAPWIVVGAIVGIFLFYRKVLANLRQRIAERDGT
ncbi:MAG: molybdopterin biosynthesis protein, partial [Pseudomonadota bacterium]